MPETLSNVVTLMTDFGLQDPYVGVMKGVILNINPKVELVDLTHAIPPQDIRSAAFQLAHCFRYFPRGTLHMVIVDPGVGTDRRPLLLASETQWFLAPDNGVLSWIEQFEEVRSVFAVTASHYFLPDPSHTFHGRDIFAPIAGWFTRGVGPEMLGEPTEQYEKLPLTTPKVEGSRVTGSVVHVDRFGNLITNLDRESLKEARGASGANRIEVQIAGRPLGPFSRTFAEGPSAAPFPLIGSYGTIEVVIKGGSAAVVLGLGPGAEVCATLVGG
jgi:S-adenosyl-L-methionine hydrolase (adenosine-forming)